jgi:hypothetical protein
MRIKIESKKKPEREKFTEDNIDKRRSDNKRKRKRIRENEILLLFSFAMVVNRALDEMDMTMNENDDTAAKVESFIFLCVKRRKKELMFNFLSLSSCSSYVVCCFMKKLNTTHHTHI